MEAPMESNGLHSSTNEEAALKPGALPSELLVYPPTGRTKKLVEGKHKSRPWEAILCKAASLRLRRQPSGQGQFGAQHKPSHQGLGSKVPNKQRYNH